MNTQKLRSSLKLLVLGILLSVGLSYASLWTTTTSVAPAGNIDVPINASATLQEKTGGLSVHTFAALGNAQLKQQVFFAGSVKGIDPGSTNPTLEIGGVSTVGAQQRVITTVTGNLDSGATIGSTELKNNTMSPLCSDENDHIVQC